LDTFEGLWKKLKVVVVIVAAQFMICPSGANLIRVTALINASNKSTLLLAAFYKIISQETQIVYHATADSSYEQRTRYFKIYFNGD